MAKTVLSIIWITESLPHAWSKQNKYDFTSLTITLPTSYRIVAAFFFLFLSLTTLEKAGSEFLFFCKSRGSPPSASIPKPWLFWIVKK